MNPWHSLVGGWRASRATPKEQEPGQHATEGPADPLAPGGPGLARGGPIPATDPFPTSLTHAPRWAPTMARVVVICGGEGPEGEFDSAPWIVQGLCDLGLEVTVLDVRDVALADKLRAAQPDVLFPVGLGVPCESGQVQGFLHLLAPGVPVVGCGVLPSAVGMNKWMSKLALRGMGLEVAEGLLLEPGCPLPFASIHAHLGLPCIGKPVLGGASLGVCQITDEQSFEDWRRTTWPEFGPLLVETCIQPQEEGVEYAVGVLETERGPLALPVCQIRSSGLYDTARKSDRRLATHQILAAGDERAARMQEIGLRIFREWGCKGYVRVDLLHDQQDRLVVLEVNTTPGMVPEVLAFPEMCQAAGIAYPHLLRLLLRSAFTPNPMDLPAQHRATWPQLPPSLRQRLPNLPDDLLRPPYQRRQPPISSVAWVRALREYLRPCLPTAATCEPLALAASLQEAFRLVRDPRPVQTRRQPLAGLLTLVTLGVLLGGARTLPGVLTWVRQQPDTLRATLGVARVPAQLWTLLGRVDRAELEQALKTWNDTGYPRLAQPSPGRAPDGVRVRVAG
jgi:D-alanine-D-alanine ligase